MLAPEEVFAPLSTEPRARSELTPAEKRTLHAKERKSRKKSRDVLDKAVDKFARKRNSVTKDSKRKKSESVVKSGKGITVVGKKVRT
jgi:U3 small nucleolar RNA-associated protein MPP10